MENALNLIFPQPIDILPYFLLGLLVMIEGPIATLMGGAAASSGLLLPLPAYLSIVLGNLTADMGWYTLGRLSKLEWLTRLSARLGVDPRRVEEASRGIRVHAPRLLFLSKLTVGFPIPTLLATGMSRVPVRRWMGMLLAGELIKSAALVLVGYLYARAVQQASEGVQITLWILTAAIVIAGAIVYRLRRRKEKRHRPGDV